MKPTSSIIIQIPSPPPLTPQSVAWYQEPITITTFLIATVIANIVAFYKSISDIRNQRKLFIEGQNLKERDDIRYKLNHFFGPMRELRFESKVLYDVFALKEKEEASKNNSYFRTVTHLADGKPLSKEDKALLNEIVEIGRKQLELIEKEGWTVTNFHLTELLGQLGAHIRILIMAYESKLGGMSREMQAVIFPLEIDGALETEVRKLQDRYSFLLHSTSKDNRIALYLNKEQDRTISYYNKNYLSYYKQTAFIDLSEIYREFKKSIPRGALILDAGCGVGRDTRYFIKHGYRVVAFDASLEMVRLCRQYSFAYCLHCCFEQISFIEEFDAVWACASLIHLSPEKLREALFRLFNSLKPGGCIYFSLKISNEGAVSKTVSEGRCFYYYSLNEVNKIAEDLGLELINQWANKSKKESDSSEWANFLYRKPRGIPMVKGISQ